MNLNQNSISAKLYRWFYDKAKHQMPTNLCPYFWKLMIMWIFIIPSAILSLPSNIYFSFDKRHYGQSKTNNPWIGLVFWGLLFIIQCIIIALSFFFVSYEEDSYFHISGFMGFVFILTIIGILIIFWYETVFKNKEEKEKKPNIILEFIKAKYNKLCPRITWDKKG